MFKLIENETVPDVTPSVYWVGGVDAATMCVGVRIISRQKPMTRDEHILRISSLTTR